MPISFACECGKPLRARDELVGKRTKCPQCGAILTIPRPDIEPDNAYGLVDADIAANSVSTSAFEDETTLSPSTFHAVPARSKQEDDWSRPPARSQEFAPQPVASTSSIREYAYLLLVFALVPLIISHFAGNEEFSFRKRLAKTMEQASPEEQLRLIQVLNNDNATKDQLMAALPGGKLEGAHLSQDSIMHWVYGAIAAVGFLLLILLFFSVERAHPLHLLGIGAFTGTIGIILLLVVQFCAQFRFRRFGRGIVGPALCQN